MTKNNILKVLTLSLVLLLAQVASVPGFPEMMKRCKDKASAYSSVDQLKNSEFLFGCKMGVRCLNLESNVEVDNEACCASKCFDAKEKAACQVGCTNYKPLRPEVVRIVL